jgi:hypothetical protein
MKATFPAFEKATMERFGWIVILGKATKRVRKTILCFEINQQYWEHNHKDSLMGTRHSIARHLQSEEKVRVRRLAGNGVSVAAIRNSLKAEFEI